jgi:hypothetical protein
MTQVFVCCSSRPAAYLSAKFWKEAVCALLTHNFLLYFSNLKQIFEVHDPDWYGNPPHVLHQNIFHSVPKHSSCCSEEGEAQLLSVSLLLLVHASLRILQIFG